MIFLELLFIGLFLLIIFLTLNLVSKQIVNYRVNKNAEQMLDATFNGEPSATYRVSSDVGLRFEQVLSGAEKRGYTLQAQNPETKKVTALVFKKAV